MRDRIAKLVPEPQAAIADFIKAIRRATQMGQRGYAQLCGVSPAALQKLELGEPAQHFQAATLDRLLRPFNYRLGVLKLAEPG